MRTRIVFSEKLEKERERERKEKRKKRKEHEGRKDIKRGGWVSLNNRFSPPSIPIKRNVVETRNLI